MLRADVISIDEEEEALITLQDLELSLRGLPSSPALPATPPTPSSPLPHTPQDPRDLTAMAVWTVSTAKPGNGVEKILDERPETYWQSDGPQPHTISARFSSKLKVSSVELYLDYAADESYTPASISVYAGCNEHDLRLVRRLRRLHEPQGWVRVPMGVTPNLMDAGDASDEDGSSEGGGEESPEEAAVRERRRLRQSIRREERRRERTVRLQERIRKRELGVNGGLEAMRDLGVTKTHMVRIVIHCNHQNGRDSHVRMVRVVGPKEQVIGSGSRFTSKEFRMYETIR